MGGTSGSMNGGRLVGCERGWMGRRGWCLMIAADRFPDPLRAMFALVNVAHRPNVRLWRGPAQCFLRLCRPNVFDVAFIDGDHHGPAVARDLRLVAGTMKANGRICCHDYEAPSHPGVTESVSQFCEPSEWCISECCHSLVILGQSGNV